MSDLPCGHDARFGGVFFAPKGTGGCVACAYEQAEAENNRLRRKLAEARDLLESTRNMWAAVSQKAALANGPSRGHVCDFRVALQSARDRALEEVYRIDAALAGEKKDGT